MHSPSLPVLRSEDRAALSGEALSGQGEVPELRSTGSVSLRVSQQSQAVTEKKGGGRTAPALSLPGVPGTIFGIVVREIFHTRQIDVLRGAGGVRQPHPMGLRVATPAEGNEVFGHVRAAGPPRLHVMDLQPVRRITEGAPPAVALVDLTAASFCQTSTDHYETISFRRGGPPPLATRSSTACQGRPKGRLSEGREQTRRDKHQPAARRPLTPWYHEKSGGGLAPTPRREAAPVSRPPSPALPAAIRPCTGKAGGAAHGAASGGERSGAPESKPGAAPAADNRQAHNQNEGQQQKPIGQGTPTSGGGPAPPGGGGNRPDRGRAPPPPTERDGPPERQRRPAVPAPALVGAGILRREGGRAPQTKTKRHAPGEGQRHPAADLRPRLPAGNRNLPRSPVPRLPFRTPPALRFVHKTVHNCTKSTPEMRRKRTETGQIPTENRPESGRNSAETFRFSGAFLGVPCPKGNTKCGA